MTTTAFTLALLDIASDLSRPLADSERFQRLLGALKKAFPCDAAALLRLHGQTLLPLAIDGLTPDTLGRQFEVNHHPRLASILLSREPVRFKADSPLPDPYDGLVSHHLDALEVHDCMGASLYIDERPWGVLTLDALQPGTFDSTDSLELHAFIALAEASVKAAETIRSLEERLQREHQVVKAVLADHSAQAMLGNSAAMWELRKEISTIAPSDLGVLILGETGVGKELVAREIHNQSTRAEEPIVYVNCAALPEQLAESELFGHVKGAFSGAINARAGKFELADGGTLFLDEIGEMPLSIQAKILRALQSGEIQRVGSDTQICVDVRLIAATNRELQKEVAEGRFRADLYHRLSVYPLRVPPLRERRQDILLLAGFFLEQNRRRLGLQAVRLDNQAQKTLLDYHWPGNVRELEHLISRSLLKAKADLTTTENVLTVSAAHLDIQPQKIVSHAAPTTLSAIKNPNTIISLKQASENFQRDYILQCLQQFHGNQAAAAEALSLDRSNFYRLLKRLGIVANINKNHRPDRQK